MRRPLVLVVALALAACSSSSPSSSGPACEQGLRAWGDAGFSGSVAVATGGSFDCLAAVGRAGVDDVFSIGSVSKAFTAAAVVQLVDDGKLSLDDRAGDLVPGLGGPAADATVHDLLLHTSGLLDGHGEDHVPLDRDGAVAAISGLGQAFPTGEDYLYSNAGYTLLALVVEAVSGQDYRSYLADRILPEGGGFWDGAPAAPGPRAAGYMDDGPSDQTGDFAGPHWALTGNGDLAMTMETLARWTDDQFGGKAIPAEAPGWVTVDDDAFGQPFLGAAGGGGDIGHDVVVAYLPESDRIVAIASNTPAVTAEQLFERIGPALAGDEPLPRPSTVEDVDPAVAAEVAGTYVLDSGGSFVVTPHDDRLTVAAVGADAVAALFPLPEDVAPEDVARHEAQVAALLDGESLVGTIVRQGELRTYATVGQETHWYALDEAGGVAAVELDADSPTLLLGADGAGFRPDDPTGSGPDLHVEIGGGRFRVDGTVGTLTRAG